MVGCKICGKEFENGRFLSAHLKFEEHIKGQDYYDTFLKKPNEGICVVCGNPTRYINFTRGYQICCSQKCNNDPRSFKSKRISDVKQSYSDAKKADIQKKRENTCLQKYGVTTNLLIGKENSDKKQVRKKCNKYKVQRTTYAMHSVVSIDNLKCRFCDKICKSIASCRMHELYCNKNPNKIASNIEKSHTPEARQKARITSQKRKLEGRIIGQNVIKSWKTRKQQIQEFCVDHNCTPIIELIKIYGQGFLSLDLPRIYINKQNNAISNEYLSIIIDYYKTNQYSNKSKAEQYIIDHLNYSGEIQHNNRKIIKPLELDIYIPELKLGLEYNGLYWHCVERGFPKDKHRLKSIACKNQGIRLIHIYEFEDLDEQIQKINQLILGHDAFEQNFTKNNLLPIPNIPPQIIYQDGRHTLYSA